MNHYTVRKNAQSLDQISAQIDLKLLRSLVVLVSEEHVTRASVRLDISQPAMSAVLARLRKVLQDPVLIRTETGMVATPRAKGVAAAVQNGLGIIEKALLGLRDFNPTTTDIHFNIAIGETGTFFLLHSLTGYTRTLAPHTMMTIHRLDATTINHQLEHGIIDVAISFLYSPPPWVKARLLMRSKMVVVAAKDHPEIQGCITLEQYRRFSHVSYVTNDTIPSILESKIEEELAQHGASRHIPIRLPSAVNSLMFVAHSDLLATVPESIALSFTGIQSLQVLKPPIDLPDVDIVMYWHERTHNSPAHRWLRGHLKDIAHLRHI